MDSAQPSAREKPPEDPAVTIARLRAYHAKSKELFTKEIKELRLYTKHLSTYVTKLKIAMTDAIAKLGGPIVDKCAEVVEAAVKERLGEKGSLRDFVTSFDGLCDRIVNGRNFTHCLSDTAMREAVRLMKEQKKRKEIPKATSTKVGAVSLELLQTISQQRCEWVDFIAEHVVEPTEAGKEALVKCKKWKDGASLPPGVPHAFTASIESLVAELASLSKAVNQHAPAPSIEMASLPAPAGINTASAKKLISPLQIEHKKRRAASPPPESPKQTVAANIVLPPVGGLLLREGGGGEECQQGDMLKHSQRRLKEEDARKQQQQQHAIQEHALSALKKSSATALVVRQRKKMATENIGKFLASLQNEVLALTQRSRGAVREGRELRRDQILMLRPSVANSKATLNSSDPADFRDEATRQHPATRILERKLGKSDTAAEEMQVDRRKPP